jgi:phosphatidylinositol alpha-1,6-mannosyltransferase
VVFVIIGDEPNNALHHKLGEKQKILQTIQDHNLADHVALLGHVSESQLKQAYLSSHLHIFPGIDLPGDVEGFGMVAIEAAAHGLPTVAFAAGGIPESVNHNTSGWLIKSGDYAAMTQTILNSINQPNYFEDKVNITSCQQHAANYSWEIFGEKIRDLCFRIIDRH